MRSITIRDVPEEVHRALRARAARHGRSTDAELRDILAAAAKPEGRVKLGALLMSIGREAPLTQRRVDGFGRLRDETPVRPMDLG